jgi:hypothetical protein
MGSKLTNDHEPADHFAAGIAIHESLARHVTDGQMIEPALGSAEPSAATGERQLLPGTAWCMHSEVLSGENIGHASVVSNRNNESRRCLNGFRMEIVLQAAFGRQKRTATSTLRNCFNHRLPQLRLGR